VFTLRAVDRGLCVHFEGGKPGVDVFTLRAVDLGFVCLP
jgi:hypothetical protein